MEAVSLDQKLQNEKPFMRKTLAFYMYGYATQAKFLGETAIYDAAYKIASSMLSPEEYQAIMTKRVGPNGEFRLTREDLAKMAE